MSCTRCSPTSDGPILRAWSRAWRRWWPAPVLAATRIACGNRVVVPGAFTVTGDRINRVCARISAIADPADPEAGTACVTLLPGTR
jgi:hypothetical protein